MNDKYRKVVTLRRWHCFNFVENRRFNQRRGGLVCLWRQVEGSRLFVPLMELIVETPRGRGKDTSATPPRD